MINRFVFLQRKAGLSLSEFRRHWRDVHGPIAATFPRLRTYLQYDISGDAAGEVHLSGGKLQVDGIAMLSFDNLRAVEKAFTPELIEALAADEGKFIGAMDLLTTVPRMSGEIPSGSHHARHISVVKRGGARSAEEFQRQWWNEYADATTALPGLRSFVQNLVIDHGFDRKKDAPYEELPADGIEELCFDNVESMTAAFASPAAAARRELANSFLDECATFVVDAHRVA